MVAELKLKSLASVLGRHYIRCQAMTMRCEVATLDASVAKLVEDYRAQCLWFLRTDYMPTSTGDILKTLALIERYGDRAGYERAEEIKAWLLRDSKPQS